MASDGCYRLFGAELSPYSVKVRSYLRYKGIPHEWVLRGPANNDEFERHARLPLIPLLITPDDEGWQDSTPIIEKLEARYPRPPIHPQEPVLAFVSALIEEYADEWGNKAMFHYRWTYEADQRSAAKRIATLTAPDADEEATEQVAAMIVARMVQRLDFVGSNEHTREQIEGSYLRQLSILQTHLERRPFLLGTRPAFADFGLYAQLYQTLSDPTPGEIMKSEAPRVVEWIERMLDPEGEGGFEDWGDLEPTLAPLLTEEIAGLFLPWSEANARALEAGEKEFSVELEGKRFVQQTQKYHARSLAVLKKRYADHGDRGALDGVLEATGCLRYLNE
ncbi:MAG: glutathione S-transferase family protein [Candidatus Binatia bacterium]